MRPNTIAAQLLVLVENEPGKTFHELALLGGFNLRTTKHYLSILADSGQLVRRYSAESLETIFFLQGEPSRDYHPLSMEEARKQQARFKARVQQYIINKVLGER